MSGQGRVIEVELLDGTVAKMNLSKLMGENWGEVWDEVGYYLTTQYRFDIADELSTEALIDLLVYRGVEPATDLHLSIESELIKRHDREHNGTIRVCRDEICDLLVRLGGGR